MTEHRPPESARDIARRVLIRVSAERAFTSLALDAELDRSALSERDRRLATELCYGVCRHLSRLDRAIASASARGRVKVKPKVRAVMRMAAYQLLFLDRIPAHAAVDDAVSAARRLAGTRVAGFVNSVLRRLARDGEPAVPGPETPFEHALVACSMPEWITKRLARVHGHAPDGELSAAAQALSGRAPLALRVNRRRATRARVAEMLLEEKPACDAQPSPWCAEGLMVTGLGDPARSPSFVDGFWTVQDIGAQLVTRLVGDMPPDHSENAPLTILDACAGVGGKATHLAERFGERARIDAADISPKKLALLTTSARRLGVLDTIRTIVADLTTQDTADTGTRLAPMYDVVLLDAPCSGLGVLRRHPEAKWRVHESDIADRLVLQRTLLDHTSRRVRPGGVLIYSVCTFLPEEGAEQVASFLERNPNFTPAPLQTAQREDAIAWSKLGPTDASGQSTGVLSTWPHRHDADAFYAARLRRTSA